MAKLNEIQRKIFGIRCYNAQVVVAKSAEQRTPNLLICMPGYSLLLIPTVTRLVSILCIMFKQIFRVKRLVMPAIDYRILSNCFLEKYYYKEVDDEADNNIVNNAFVTNADSRIMIKEMETMQCEKCQHLEFHEAG
ncbi:hypothetical protein KIN20_010116 [Parelaphostrongylus tenuis]|uniref:Uncharacterized protein n=1 Tax=Parelaphostrongylus tenuis TaxID=148309 RepID=A0AAD5M7E5_PARTN|nr:hypothetical protein KIN20_010116 [Parelaphostrongylus tenuis]